MKYFQLIVYSFLLFALTINAQEHDSLAIKIVDKEDVLHVFSETVYSNPSNYLNYRKYSLTEFKFANENLNRKSNLLQEGSNQRLFDISANAYQKLDGNKAVWGQAKYKQGKRENVQWNESADYDKIFPYVVADSIGGDIKYEHYRFEGGYVQQVSDFNIGVSGYYQAQVEYRKIDPRPKNVSSIFGFKIGGSRNFHDKIYVGINLDLEKYTQKHRMSFYNPLGSPTIYQLSGLGNYNSLLKGKRKDAYFEGWTYGVGVQLYEPQNKTWFLTAEARWFDFEKLLPEFYDLQVGKIRDSEYKLSLGKLFIQDNVQWGFSIDGISKERVGTENLFMVQSTTNYVKIGDAERYKFQSKMARLKGLWKYTLHENVYSLMPFIEYNQVTERYKTPYSKTDVSYLTYGISGQWLHSFKNKSIFTSAINFTSQQISKDKAIFSFSDSNAINQMLIANYKYQTTSNWSTTLKLRYDFPIPDIINAFVGFDFNYQHYSLGNNNGYLGSIGITF